MLILTRRPRETVSIGHDVTVTMLRINGNQVRIRIDAPITIPLRREEIYERINRDRGASGWPVTERGATGQEFKGDRNSCLPAK